MRDMDNLCVNCFKELTEGAVCTHCGYDNDTQNETICLPAKEIIGGKYVVGAFHKRDSDSLTYIGYDLQLDKKIFIREFCPKNFSNRLEGNKVIHVRQKFVNDFKKCRQSFIKLWTTLEKMQNLSAVVPVYDVFEENGTAYAIIEFMDSIPLREYLLRNENGYISWDSARIMFMPILTTLESLHQNGIIHGSLTPDNLLLYRDGKVRLSPFTIQQCCDAKTDLEFNETEGYTALEQYDNNHKICPATDIYAFSACVYRALVGTNPANAQSREENDKLMIPNSIAETIPIHVIKALGAGLQIYPEKRIKNISDFRDELDASPIVQAKAAVSIRQDVDTNDTPAFDYAAASQPKKKKNGKSTFAIIVLIILIIAAVVCGVYVIKNEDSKPEQSTVATSEAISDTVEVPNFTNNGITQTDVQNNAAWNQQFNITYNFEYSDKVELGFISGQSIAAGEIVNSKTAIVLTVSKGVQTEVVPNVSGLMFEEAKNILEEKGFKVSSVEVYNDGTHVEKQCKSAYATAPAENEVVAVGSEIIVQVYGVAQTTTAPAEETTADAE